MRKIIWALGTILLGASIAWGQACGSLVVNPVTGQLDCIGTNGSALLPPPSGNTGDVPFMNGTGALQVDHGNFQYVLGSPNTFKAPSFFFGGGLTGLISNTQGADVACATTIAPTSQIGRLTGTGTVTTITPPSAFTVGGGNGTGGIVTLIPTAACTFATGGNITLPAGFTATPNAPIAFIYMSTQNTWWAIQETGTVTSVLDDGAGHFTITNPTTTPTLTFVGQANDYSFSQINGSLGASQLPASGLRLPVSASPGAGPPTSAISCIAGVNYYFDSTNHDYWDCNIGSPTNQWNKELSTTNSGVGNILLLNGANPCGSVTASNDCLSFNASDNLTWKDSAAATHLTGNFTSAPAGGSCVQTSGTTGLLVETGSACSGTSGYATVQSPPGTALTARTKIAVRSGLMASDDSTNTRTPLDNIAVVDPTIVTLTDEFCHSGTASGSVGELGWLISNVAGTATFTSSISTSFTNPCEGQLNTPATTSDGGWLNLQGGTGLLGALYNNTQSAWAVLWNFSMPSTTSETVFIGVGSNGNPPTDFGGVRFDTTVPDTNFMLCLYNNTTNTTCTSSGVAADTANHTVLIMSDEYYNEKILQNSAASTSNLKVWMVFDGGTGVSFCASGCTVTVTPRTNSLLPFPYIVAQANTAVHLDLDKFGYWARVSANANKRN